MAHADAATLFIDAAADITRDQGKDVIHNLFAVHIKVLQGHQNRNQFMREETSN
jgi:hypothetical protein